jgi:hypothetical protein
MVGREWCALLNVRRLAQSDAGVLSITLLRSVEVELPIAIEAGKEHRGAVRQVQHDWLELNVDELPSMST